MKRWLLLPLALAATSMPAIAGQEDWKSPSGKTEFVGPRLTVCASPSRVIDYRTEYQGIKYAGTLWVKNSPNCRSAETVISGYFEERNKTKGEWCNGNLTLRLNQSSGSATWTNIKAVPGYKCTGAGKPFTLDLKVSP
jgi:hypothetical protein